MNVFARVSRSYVDVEDVISALRSKADALVVYEHEQDEETSRTHIHFYIEGLTITIEGVKKMFKKRCPDLQRTDWAFNLKNVNRSCITYMSKGRLEPMYNEGGIDANEYKEFWEERVDKNSKKYQAKLSFVKRETAGESKKRKNDLVDEMLAELGNGYKPGDEETRTYGATCVDMKVVHIIIKVLNDNRHMLTRYTIREYYDTISARTKPKAFASQMEKFLDYKV